jgi:hypothetical protein
LSYLLGPWAVDGSFVIYKGIEGGFEQLRMSGADRQTKQGFFSGMLRGVSNPGEGSEILSFPSGPDWCAARSYISEARGETV